MKTDFNAGIGLVRMMGMTNYLALVGGGRSPKFAMNKVRQLYYTNCKYPWHPKAYCIPGDNMG